MALSDIGLLFRIKSDSSDAVGDFKRLRQTVASELEAIDKSFDRMGGNVRNVSAAMGRDMSRAFDSFAGNIASQVVSSLTSALQDSARAVLDYTSKLEQTKIGFDTLLGSGEKATKFLGEIQEMAKRTPFEFADLAGFTQKLIGANVELEKVLPLMRDIGNVVSSVGGNKEDLAGTVRAITQIISLGRVSAEEMNQLSERNINGFRILAKEMGKTQGEVRKLAENGEISADDFLKAFQRSAAGVSDAMDKQSKTFAGAMSNIKDSVMIAATTAFKPLYDRISSLAVDTAKLIDRQKGDFHQIGVTIAKSIAKGTGEALANLDQQLYQALKDNYEGKNKQKYYSPVDFGAGIMEGFLGDRPNLEEWWMGVTEAQKRAKRLAANPTEEQKWKNVNFVGLDGMMGRDYEYLKRNPVEPTGTGTGKAKKEKKELSPKAKAIIAEAEKLGISPLDYATIISFETAGTFSTSIQSTDKKTGKNYTGLIQFGPEEVKKYGVKRGEDFAAQLAKASDFLRDRFEAANKSISSATILDLYRTVLGGNPNASLTGQDSNGTSPLSGVRKMMREHRPGAMKLLDGKGAGSEFDTFKAEEEIAKEQEKRREDRIKAEEDAMDQLTKLEQASAETRLKSLDSFFSQGLLKEGDYAKQVAAIKLQFFEDEKTRNIALLTNTELSEKERINLLNEGALLDERIAQQKIENADSIREAVKNQLEEERRLNEEVLELKREVLQSEAELINFRKEQERKVLVNTIENPRTKKERENALVILREFDIAEAQRRKEQADAEAEMEFEASIARIGNIEDEYKKLEELDKLYQNRKLQSEEAFQAAKKEIEGRFKQDRKDEIPTSGIEQLGGAISEGIGGIFGDETLENMKLFQPIIDSITNSFGAMAQAVGDSVQAFVLFGSAGGSFRKFAAELIASIAKMAAIQSVWNLAEGFAKLAMAFFGHPTAGASATQHFVAAGVYAGIAGIAAVAGRGVAGDSFKQQTGSNAISGGTNNSVATTNQNNTITGERVRPGELDRQQTIRLMIQSNDSHIVRVVDNDIETRGRLHGTFVKIVEG